MLPAPAPPAAIGSGLRLGRHPNLVSGRTRVTVGKIIFHIKARRTAQKLITHAKANGL